MEDGSQITRGVSSHDAAILRVGFTCLTNIPM